jgi:hypothetical protein
MVHSDAAWTAALSDLASLSVRENGNYCTRKYIKEMVEVRKEGRTAWRRLVEKRKESTDDDE